MVLVATLALWAAVQPITAAPADTQPANRPAGGLSWARESGAVALHRDGAPVWRFNYGTNTTKPCFHPVAVPGGPTLTWDKPPDHAWHHALWFSWKYIDRVNYWETEAKSNEARGVTQWSEPQIETRPDFSARIVLDLAYRPPNGTNLLTEHRVIEVSPPDKRNTYHLDWTMTFTALDKDVLLDRTPLPGEPGGQPWGGYAGLSVRLAKDLKDPRAVTSGGPVSFTGGTYRGKGTAMDYSGLFEGIEAGLAVLDSAGNPNSPSPWYAIANNTMHYFSPAVIQEAPCLLKAGQPFTLRYRVIAHPGRWDAEHLREAAKAFGTEKVLNP